MNVTALIGLGGNLGDTKARLDAALVRLDAVEGVSVGACSRFYRTPPWGPVAQPDFVNAVAVLHTTLSAHDLLDVLLSVERAFGRDRERGERWGPRTLDLDLLAYGEATIEDERLSVPHPRIAERAFVLLPMADIAPDASLPGLGRVVDLLAAIDTGECHVLP